MNDWTYLPMIIGAGVAVVGLFYAGRHQDTSRGRWTYAYTLSAALVLISISSAATSIVKGLDGQPYLLVVGVLVIALSGVVIHQLLDYARSADNEGAIAAYRRRSRVRWPAIIALGALMLLIIVGGFAGELAANAAPGNPALQGWVTASSVGGMVLITSPLWGLYIATVRRQKRSETSSQRVKDYKFVDEAGTVLQRTCREETVVDGQLHTRFTQSDRGSAGRQVQRKPKTRHPLSAEVADTIYDSAVKATRQAVDARIASPKVLLLGLISIGGVVVLMLIFPLILGSLGEGEPSTPAWLLWLSAALIVVLTLATIMFGMFAPVFYQMLSRYRFAGLSHAELAEASDRRTRRALPAPRSPHADTLQGNHDLVRAVTIAASGLVTQETVELGVLAGAPSLPLDELVEFFTTGASTELTRTLYQDMSSVAEDDDGQYVSLLTVLRVAAALSKIHGENQRFDAFLVDGGVTVLAAGATEYENVLSSTAHALARAM